MIVADHSNSIFISYAWGACFEKKEWLRESIITSLNWKYDVFWDRDTIALGELLEHSIRNALKKRPLLVLCLCDQDYLAAAQKDGSGLYTELRLLAEIAHEPGVRIIPLILEPGCAEHLPAPLSGRLYVDLQALHCQSLPLGLTVLGVAEGLSQAQLQNEINDQITFFRLRQRAIRFMERHPILIWGNGLNHEVMVHPDNSAPYLLKPPQWMQRSKRWDYMLGDEGPTSNPMQGRWHWEYIAISTEFRPLATAVVSTFFPMLTGENEESLLNSAGTQIATKFFRMIYIHEPFTFNANDLIDNLLASPSGADVLERLLNAAESCSESKANNP